MEEVIYDKDGYDKKGFNVNGINRDTGTAYNSDGYDIKGYDAEGYNAEGINRKGKARGEQSETSHSKIKNYLGLLDKAEKLAKGQLSIQEYISKSKMSIDDLIVFAKKQNMSAEVIKGLYKYVKPYKLYTKPFSKTQYLAETTLIIDGKEVKPTEQDVDLCIDYMKINEILVCDKNVRDIVRKYIKGEIDITNVEKEQTEPLSELAQQEAKQKELQSTLQQTRQLKAQAKSLESQKYAKNIGEQYGR